MTNDMKNNHEQENTVLRKEAAELLKCSVNNIGYLIKTGKLDEIKLGPRNSRVTLESIERHQAHSTKEDSAACSPDRSDFPEIVSPELPGVSESEVEEEKCIPANEEPTVAMPPVERPPVEPPTVAEPNLSHITQVTRIETSSVEDDWSLQVRVEIDEELVDSYAQKMGAGESFPPLDLFSNESGDRFWVGDGWHRLLAARKNNYKRFPATIHTGGKVAALRWALGANVYHGKERTHEDRLHALTLALHHFPDLSKKELASLCGLEKKFVLRHKKACELAASELIQGKNGKFIKAPKAVKPLKKPRDPKRWLRNANTVIRNLGEEDLSQLTQQIQERSEALDSASPSPELAVPSHS